MEKKFEHLFLVDSFWDKLIATLNKKYPYRTFYRGLVPKFLRHFWERKLDLIKQEKIERAWNVLIDNYLSGSTPTFKLSAKQNFPDQKIIWQYWGQPCEFHELPETVQICFKSAEQFADGYRIIRLNDNNIGEYLDLPDFVAEKRKNPAFKYAFFADLLRLALLDTYGGIWMDATILLTGEIPYEMRDQSFFMFQRDKNSENKVLWSKPNQYFSWAEEHKINFLNSFICAKQNDFVIHTLLNLLLIFWKTQNNIPHYFFFQILMNTLINHYFPDKRGIIIDDTIPHLLAKNIKNRFDPELYAQITAKTAIHKLTYTKKYASDSFFAALKENYLMNK